MSITNASGHNLACACSHCCTITTTATGSVRIGGGGGAGGNVTYINPGSLNGVAGSPGIGGVDARDVFHRPCRICGSESKTQVWGIPMMLSNELCAHCSDGIMKDLIAIKVSARAKVDGCYCMDCMSHVKACSCDKKKALDSLKK